MEDEFCSECGKELHPGRIVWAAFSNATGEWVDPETLTGVDDGLQPLGRKCAKNLNIPKEWINGGK